MPFTLAHPAAVLPLLRGPAVPAALVAGAMASDVPYFLNAGGITSTNAGDWYEPFLNATRTHSLGGLPISLLYAVAMVVAYRVVRAPVTALLPSGVGLPTSERPASLSARSRHLLSALVGIATHLGWDSVAEANFLPVRLREAPIAGLTTPRLLQYASTALGLAVLSWFLWSRRSRLRTDDDDTRRLSTVVRRVVAAGLVATAVLGGAALAHADYDTYSTVTQVDYSHPVTVDEGNGVTSTEYPTTTVPASWGTVAEGVLTGAAKRAGAAFAVSLLLYAAAWQLATASRKRPRPV